MFSLVFLVLFINLGFWQLRRADEKVRLLEQQAARASQPSRPLAQVPSDSQRADQLPVILRGHYDRSETFLLDNRVLNGRVGFEVLSPFHDNGSDKYVLVDRGFVAMGRTRSDMPDIPPLKADSGTATGTIYVARSDSEKPQDQTTALGPDTTIVEAASPLLIARLMGKSFYAHVVRLAKSDPNALPRYWPVTMMMPSRHRAYAVQWFLMAVAVLGAWSAFSFRRDRRMEES